MDVEKTIAFLLEHQASFAVRMGQIAERLDQVTGRLDQVTERVGRLAEEGTKTRADLRRAIRLGVQEARAERARRRDLESKLEDLAVTVRTFIQSLERGRNGH